MFLRDREVLFQSVRAMNGHRAGNADQFPGFDIEGLAVFKVEKLFTNGHAGSFISACAGRNPP